MEIQTVLVSGAGTMGHGIAQVAAQAGCEVFLHDVSKEAIQKGLSAIDRDLTKGIEREKVTPEQREAVLARLHEAADLSGSAQKADLVVEAIPESLELKQQLFKTLSQNTSPETILATNTSSLSIDAIAGDCVQPERVIGMHFFNPVPRMALLELVHGARTSKATIDRSLEFAKAIGKEPIVVKDMPGFASSRLGVVLGLEAMRMLEQGVASAEDIDKAMTLGYRHPMGPLKLTDLVGLDVRLAIAEHLYRTLESEAFRPPEILRNAVEAGKLGKKSGEGFYTWD